MKRLGVDVGGTFTDLVLWDDANQRIATHKVPSTPTDPAVGMMSGLSELCAMQGVELGQLDQLLLGTTVATNIVVERNGQDVGLITTKGFRDVTYIGRHRRTLTFSIMQDLPWRDPPLARRANRIGVTERITAPNGAVLVPLNEEEVRLAARRFKDSGVETISICFLFSFLNPEHEQRARSIVLEEYPDAHVSTSSDIVPLHREYERFSTTLLNSYVGPKTSRYLKEMRGALSSVAPDTTFNLMTSNGGLTPIDTAIERPVSLLLSGPVAGVIGGIWIGQNSGHENVITLDVGGTSADIGVSPGGRLRMKGLYDTSIGGYDLMLPMVDVDTIGAGGGSIAYIDPGGLLRVGPKSAGAAPGPACYGRGGTDATATDAQVALGRLRPETFLGGRMTISVEASLEAIDRHVATPLKMSVEQAAMGVVRVMNHNMVRALELNSVRKGYDPREFSLVAFGGAGPLSACDIASELSIPQVIVPPHPGNGSAVGLLSTDVKYEVSRTVMVEAAKVDPDYLNGVFEQLEAEGLALLAAADVPPEMTVVQRWADCRFTGQAYELLVPVLPGRLDREGLQTLEAEFKATHEREYFGAFTRDRQVQIVHVRVYAIGVMPALSTRSMEQGGPEPDESAIIVTLPVAFLGDGGDVVRRDTPFYDMSRLLSGNRIAGPAIVEHSDSTTVINPGLAAEVGPTGNLVISRSTP